MKHIFSKKKLIIVFPILAIVVLGGWILFAVQTSVNLKVYTQINSNIKKYLEETYDRKGDIKNLSKPIYVKSHAIITGIYNTQAGSSGFIIYFDKKKIVPHRYEIEGSLTNISIGKVNMDQQKLEGEDVITIVGFELPANITQYEIEGLKQTINVNDGKIFNVILVDHQNDSIYNIGLLERRFSLQTQPSG